MPMDVWHCVVVYFSLSLIIKCTYPVFHFFPGMCFYDYDERLSFRVCFLPAFLALCETEPQVMSPSPALLVLKA